MGSGGGARGRGMQSKLNSQSQSQSLSSYSPCSSSLDDPVPSPCIITFGGSALRTGGGYAEAQLHVLENPPLDVEEKNGDDGEGGGEGEGVASATVEGHYHHTGGGLGFEGGGGGGRKGSSGTVGGLVSFADSQGSRRHSLSKFQT